MLEILSLNTGDMETWIWPDTCPYPLNQVRKQNRISTTLAEELVGVHTWKSITKSD